MIRPETFPNKWPIIPLSEAVEFLDSRRKPVKASDRVEGAYPYYGANGQQGTINDYIFDEPLVLLAEDGGHFGIPGRKVAYSISGKTWVNNHAHVLRFNSKNIKSWVEIYLNYKNVDNFISGMAQPKLNKAKLNQIPIPIPEVNKLKELNENIANAKDIIKKADINLIKKSELLDNLKSSILKEELNTN